jgi:hypothetical protein
LVRNAERPLHPREVHQIAPSREEARGGILERFPTHRYQTEIESWRHLQSDNIEFTLKRLREPIGDPVRAAPRAPITPATPNERAISPR